MQCLDLLARGADIHSVTEHRTSALHLAAWSGHEQTCLALLESGANVACVNLNGDTALHAAARFGFSRTCLLLLERGCDPRIKNVSGETALIQAIERKQAACAATIRSFITAQAARQSLQEMSAVRIGSSNALVGAASCPVRT